MLDRLKSWLRDRSSANALPPSDPVGRTGVRAALRPKKLAPRRPDPEVDPGDASFSGEIEDAGPNKNVLIRNKYIREDTGTHETLKILDDSLVDSGEETGIDPYNTGGFDRSKNWNNRFKK